MRHENNTSTVITPDFDTLLDYNFRAEGEYFVYSICGKVFILSLAAAGLALGAIAFGPLGATAGCVLSAVTGLGLIVLVSPFLLPPLTLAAQRTRQFMDASIISDQLDHMTRAFTGPDKNEIIHEILQQDENAPFGIRSQESAQLIIELSSVNSSINEKWRSLCAYMNKQLPNGAHANNGKKLFNTVMSVIAHRIRQTSTIDHNDNLTLPKELKHIFDEINQPKWDTMGTAFFGKKVPDGINAMRLCFEEALKNIPKTSNTIQNPLDQLTPDVQKTLAKKLMAIVNAKRSAPSRCRAFEVDQFYCNFPDLTASRTFQERLEDIDFNFEDLPEQYQDPIAMTIMKEPVKVPCITKSEVTARYYDKATIEEMKKTGRNFDPVDNTSPLPTVIVVDEARQQEIRTFVEEKEREYFAANEPSRTEPVATNLAPTAMTV